VPRNPLTDLGAGRSDDLPYNRIVLDIMLPFYGRMDHMHEAVRSVLAQTDDRWRLVIIDDAYPDESLGEWVAALADQRIEYRRNPANLGILANFQLCIDLATAEHLVIMGCDDIMLPGYVEHIHSMIEKDPDAAFYHAGSQIIDADSQVVRTLVDTAKAYYRPRTSVQISIGGEQLAVTLMRGVWTNFPAIAWKREVIAEIGFDARFVTVQDIALMVDILARGYHLALDETVVFQYRRHATSVSSYRAVDGSRFVEEKAFFTHTAKRLDALGWKRAARAARAHFSSRVLAGVQVPGALIHGDGKAVRTLLGHAFR
jgi:glycosyltransferase involved in cell wall biosynthesis